VIAADTLVVIDARVLGKPADARQAESHLASLCGRTHRVITAVAVVRADALQPREALVESEVALRAASAEEIRAYVATGEPLDKAGGYALQGEGRRFVERVIGSESNVIGLPLEETLELLRAEGVVARRAS
jgi:septum formation protein